MFSFSLSNFSQKKKPVLESVWRIDSECVSVTLFYDTQPHDIVFYHTIPHALLLLDDRHRADQLYHAVEKGLLQLATMITAEFQQFPGKALVVIGEPWVHTLFRRVTHKRKTEFSLTQSIVQDIVKRDFKTVALHQYGYDQAMHTDPVEPYVHTVSIGGYPVSEWKHKKTHDVRIDYMGYFFDRSIINLMHQVIHEKLRVRLLAITSAPVHYFLIHYWKQYNQSTQLIIHPSGSVTHMIQMKNGLFIESGTLPVGLHTMYQKMARILGISIHEVATLARMYQQKILQDSVQKKFLKAFQKSFFAWEQEFQSFCTHAVTQGAVIEQVVWVGGMQDQIMHFVMQSVKDDHGSFPIIFGNTHVGFTHSASFLQSQHQGGMITAMDDVDRIIIQSLN